MASFQESLVRMFLKSVLKRVVAVVLGERVRERSERAMERQMPSLRISERKMVVDVK